MRLSQLSTQTGASTATLKFWIRAGVLPPGELRNQTTADYRQSHVDRVALIQGLRAHLDLSIDAIRELTALIDDADVPLIAVLGKCQLLATGMQYESAGSAASTAKVDSAMATLGWPNDATTARMTLVQVLDEAARAGADYGVESLVQYAHQLMPIARGDIATVATQSGEPSPSAARSRDVIALATVIGAATQIKVLVAMNNLAHAVAASEAQHDDYRI